MFWQKHQPVAVDGVLEAKQKAINANCLGLSARCSQAEYIGKLIGYGIGKL